MNWLESSVALALANTLLHFLWQGAMIALILGIALRLARDSSRVRYGLAAAAMFATPLVFVATSLCFFPTGQTAPLRQRTPQWRPTPEPYRCPHRQCPRLRR